MKKQTLKKRTKKIEESEGIVKNKESENVIKNYNYGITLIALVITVIVLLILAGISISMLSGNNTILSRATQAKTKTGNAQDEETISLAYLSVITGKYADNSDNSTTTLTNELEKTYGSGNITVTKDDSNNTYTVAITGKGSFTIDSNGKVEKSGPLVSYANIRIVTNSDGTGENVAAATKTPTTDKLYIYFEASVENGTTSISPSVPFEISQNGTYNFTITSTVNGDTYTTKYSVTANQYAVRAGIKIGDYITYTSPTASVTFNGDETGYSTYATKPATLNRKTLFRVMDIDKETGEMKLLGEFGSNDPKIYFGGAKAYNNAVYTLDTKCNDLYKNTTLGITAMSIKLEDIIERFNSSGTGRLMSYASENVGNLSTGTNIKSINAQKKIVTYTKAKSYYPDIYGHQEGSGIDIYSENENKYMEDILKKGDEDNNGQKVIGESDKYYLSLTSNTSKQADTNLTTKYTYYNTSHNASDFDSKYGDTTILFNMFFVGGNTSYWLSSRCVNCKYSYAEFGLRNVMGNKLDSFCLFSSDRPMLTSYQCYCIRPIVTIPPTIKVTPCTGDNSSTNTHTVVTTN